MRAYRKKRKLEGNPVRRKKSDKEAGRLFKWHRDKLRELVYQIKGKLCHYCQNNADQMDHIYPIVLGGSDDLINVVPCCLRCNSSKGKKTVKEWKEQLKKFNPDLYKEIFLER